MYKKNNKQQQHAMDFPFSGGPEHGLNIGMNHENVHLEDKREWFHGLNLFYI